MTVYIPCPRDCRCCDLHAGTCDECGVAGCCDHCGEEQA